MNDKLAPDALIEAALLTQIEPLSERAMRELCVPPLSPDKLIDVLSTLKARWHNRALQLVHTHEGWRFQIDARAVMETLAIIAYQQPVTRGDIEGIRGVAVSGNVMQTLQDRGWIEAIGHRDSIGRPALWATTEAFLTDLQLSDLTELPPLTELGELVLPDLMEMPSEAEEEAEAEAIENQAEKENHAENSPPLLRRL